MGQERGLGFKEYVEGVDGKERMEFYGNLRKIPTERKD